MRAPMFTLTGFLMVLWGALCAFLGQNFIAAVSVAGGSLVFAAGFIQMTSRPKSVAKWLAANF